MDSFNRWRNRWVSTNGSWSIQQALSTGMGSPPRRLCEAWMAGEERYEGLRRITRKTVVLLDEVRRWLLHADGCHLGRQRRISGRLNCPFSSVGIPLDLKPLQELCQGRDSRGIHFRPEDEKSVDRRRSPPRNANGVRSLLSLRCLQRLIRPSWPDSEWIAAVVGGESRSYEAGND